MTVKLVVQFRPEGKWPTCVYAREWEGLTWKDDTGRGQPLCLSASLPPFSSSAPNNVTLLREEEILYPAFLIALQYLTDLFYNHLRHSLIN